MNVSLFAKRGKPTVTEVERHLGDNFDVVKAHIGIPGDDFPDLSRDAAPDILISYISPWIIPNGVLRKTKLWNINFHPGPPEYPGIGCFNFAIYNQESRYGVTAHIMEEKVDCGKIVGVSRFDISKTDSVYDLSVKSYDAMLILFREIIDYVKLHNDLPETAERWSRKPYTRIDLERLCRIGVEMTPDEIKNRVRATSYPGMPGAYIELFGDKFEHNPRR